MQTLTVALSAMVPQSDEYVATIKSRRSATLIPQVDGYLTDILVHSGEHAKAGQITDGRSTRSSSRPRCESQVATERQKQAVYEFNQTEVERQRKLFAAGVTSRDSLDVAEQAYQEFKGRLRIPRSPPGRRKNAQLSYYKITAPFDGIVGDIPVHLGDYVSSTHPAHHGRRKRGS